MDDMKQLAHICPICKRWFMVYIAPLWVYKRRHHSNDNAIYYCRWSCMRQAEREEEQKAEERKKKRKLRQTITVPPAEELEKMLDAGMTPTEIAKKYDCHRTTVFHLIKKYGLKGIKERQKEKPEFQRPTKEELDAMLDTGLSIAQVAEKCGCHRTAICYWVGKYGLKTPTARLKEKAQRKITSRDEYMEYHESREELQMEAQP